MPSQHPDVLKIQGVSFVLLRYTAYGISVTQMLDHAKSMLRQNGRIVGSKDPEFNLVIENMKNFPIRWRGYVSRIIFPCSDDHRRYTAGYEDIAWYGKGHGRRWRSGYGNFNHSVMSNPSILVVMETK